MMSGGANGPLKKFRILEVCHMLAGPYCGMLLADLGAEVIKIETGDGDIARSTGAQSRGGHNVYFASLNRNKKSISLDLASDHGRDAFHELVRTSHGLITNLRPRAIKKLGLTYDSLKRYNSRIACVALTGFGLEGPYSDYPAYDYIIQAMTGIAMLTGEPGGPPVRAGYSVVDNTGGMMAAIGLLSKLAEGSGGQVDIALYDMILSQLNYLAATYLNGGEEPKRLPDGGHAYFVPAQFFGTADGYIALFITHDQFWRVFADKLGKPEWLEDPRFANTQARSANREVVVESIASVLRGRASEHWVSLLQPVGVVIAGVRTLSEALKDRNTTEREMVVGVADVGLRLVGNPIKVLDCAPQYQPPPLLGEHTALFIKGTSKSQAQDR